MTPPPRPPRFLRLFAVALGIVVLAILGALFGVQVEAKTVGDGILVPRDAADLRAPMAGLIAVLRDGRPLRPGDELAPGEAVATVRSEVGGPEVTLTAPAGAARWIVLGVPVEHGQAVRAGDVVAGLAAGGSPLLARLDFDEDDSAGVVVGQRVRLTSPAYPSRLYGYAVGTVERVEPAATPGPDGRPRLRVWAAVTETPYPLRPGGGVRGEVLLGRKPAYRVILEH